MTNLKSCAAMGLFVAIAINHLVACALLHAAESTDAAGVVVADVAHAASHDKMTVLDRSPTGFSELWAALARRASRTGINREALRPETLADVDLLLITTVAPDKPLSSDEIQAVKHFVSSGGVLLVTTNDLSREGVDAWIKLAEQFGIQSHGSVTRITGGDRVGRAHVSRYSGAGLVRWLPDVYDAWLYYAGTNAGPVGGEVLIRSDLNALAARRQIGKGWVYAFGGGDIIGNAFVSSAKPDVPDQSERPVANSRLIDGLAEEILSAESEPGSRGVE